MTSGKDCVDKLSADEKDVDDTVNCPFYDKEIFCSWAADWNLKWLTAKFTAVQGVTVSKPGHSTATHKTNVLCLELNFGLHIGYEIKY